LALSWDDADLKRRILHISKSVRYTKDFDENGNAIGDSFKITIPKTLSSVRDIYYTKNFDDMWR